MIWAGSDFYEFFYHRLGHVNFTFWQQHKHHHVFYNPSPFSVIADEWVDQVSDLQHKMKYTGMKRLTRQGEQMIEWLERPHCTSKVGD